MCMHCAYNVCVCVCDGVQQSVCACVAPARHRLSPREPESIIPFSLRLFMRICLFKTVLMSSVELWTRDTWYARARADYMPGVTARSVSFLSKYKWRLKCFACVFVHNHVGYLRIIRVEDCCCWPGVWKATLRGLEKRIVGGKNPQLLSHCEVEPLLVVAFLELGVWLCPASESLSPGWIDKGFSSG
jgi:hypothetical protein